MTERLPVSPAPGPLEDYSRQFDALFSQRNQRESFRRSLEGLLLPQERNKTLTALAKTEPVVGAQHPHAQSLQWFLSESTWDPDVVTQRRVELLCVDPVTAPTERGCWSSTSMGIANGATRPRTSAGSTLPTWARPTTASSA